MMKTDPEALRRYRVRRAAKLLDEFNPGWAERVAAALGRMAASEARVSDPFLVGTVHGEILNYYDSLTPKPASWVIDSFRGLGVDGDAIRDADFPRLAPLWDEEIRSRLGDHRA